MLLPFQARGFINLVKELCMHISTFVLEYSLNHKNIHTHIGTDSAVCLLCLLRVTSSTLTSILPPHLTGQVSFSSSNVKRETLFACSSQRASLMAANSNSTTQGKLLRVKKLKRPSSCPVLNCSFLLEMSICGAVRGSVFPFQ